jgi:hemerythrin-like domain-containing protein
MKPTDELKAEHEAIKQMLRIMGKVCDNLDAQKKVEPKDLEAIVEFIQVFADKCHHAKEEGTLFPAMIDAGIPAQGGPVSVMLAEHFRGRDYVKNIKAAIAAYKNGEPQAAQQIVDNARGYIALLGQHIDKEDFILYPMADRVLSETAQRRLEKEFARIEDEIVGHGKHEQFHDLLERLAKVYLSD